MYILNNMKTKISYKRNATCIEDCISITPKDVFAVHSRVIRYSPRETVVPKGVSVSYYLEDPQDKLAGVTTIVGDGAPEHIELEAIALHLGTRYAFRCGCGERAFRMFLAPRGSKFHCRRCVGLPYRAHTMTFASPLHKKLAKLRAIESLADARANITNPYYGDHLTVKFKRFVKRAEKLGFTEVVDGARALEEFLKSKVI